MKVSLPIEVPKGRYCFVFVPESWRTICEHFDSEDGCLSCDLKFYGQRENKKGVLKSPNCMELEVIR